MLFLSKKIMSTGRKYKSYKKSFGNRFNKYGYAGIAALSGAVLNHITGGNAAEGMRSGWKYGKRSYVRNYQLPRKAFKRGFFRSNPATKYPPGTIGSNPGKRFGSNPGPGRGRKVGVRGKFAVKGKHAHARSIRVR